MGELHINFTEPSPAPASYKVRYKLTSTSTWTETTEAGSPPFVISPVTSNQEYDVEVYSDCGAGVFSSADTDVAPWAQCDSYTFENTGGTTENLTYYPCGYNDTAVVVSMAPGDTVGPVCLAASTSIPGNTLYIVAGGIVITGGSSNCTVTTPTGE